MINLPKKRKSVPKTLTFNGKRYSYYFFYTNPNDADYRAWELREEGWLVKIVKRKGPMGYDEWRLYRRRK